jgi:hypothetical protein
MREPERSAPSAPGGDLTNNCDPLNMIADPERLMIESQIDLFTILEKQLDSKQRIAAVRTIIANIDEEGVIVEIRQLVGSSRYDD